MTRTAIEQNRMGRRGRGAFVLRLVALCLCLVVALGSGAAGAPPAVPAPKDVLGFTPGEDRKLAAYSAIAEYFRRLAEASDRVRLEEIGPSTLGRPMLLATITSPENMTRLERYREIQRRLADPRTIRSDEEARALVDEGRAVVLVTFGIHSTEVGSTLSSTLVAHRLATDDSPETRKILDECIVLLVPSLNPDGVDIVKSWYDASLGEPWEGSGPPELYHHYTGHDNNRDWYAFTQAETRSVVDRVHNAWHPQILNDVHQQGPYGSRLFLPPYLDPIEPNVPPEIVAGANAIGTAAAWMLGSWGRSGVVTDAIYDAWTPARAYVHYHGGIRILSETASARMASPLEVKPERLSPGRGYDPRKTSGNFPNPWPGGVWRLQNIVDYMTDSTRAVLLVAAHQRQQLLANFYRIGRNAVTHAEGEPFAFILPPEPELLPEEGASPAAAAVRARVRGALLDTLARGGVEIRIARAPFTAGDTRFPAGSAVIAYDQPYGAFAKALLERQDYPNLRLYENGPPVTPYDVAAHTLSLLMGFDATRVDRPFTLPEGAPYTLEPDEKAPSGSLLAGRRIGLYGGATAPMDEGWTRWLFDRFGVAYTKLDERAVRVGGLRDRFDAILLPDMSPPALESGLRPGSAPAELTGGLGEEGKRALGEFVDRGGALVALNRAAPYAISALELPVANAARELPREQFYCPGSILALDLATPRTPISAGIAQRTIAWFENGPIFEVTEQGDGVRVLARYAPASDLLVSGWIFGEDRLAGTPAILEVARGSGRVVLFGFRPQYRGQSLATLPLLLNALAGGG